MKKPGKQLYFSLIAAAVLILDQLVKFFVKKIELNKDVFDLGFFSFTHVNNYGAGFSLLQGYSWLFVIVGLVFVVLILFFYNKIDKDWISQIGFALLLGGAASNLIDRISYGYVIDYLNFKIWPVFNIADSAITVGAVLVIVYLICQKHNTG